MSNITVQVDTRPMADAIHGVTHHVDATTVAVATMQTAVIQAGNTATQTICQNVARGFFSMLHSQISQKMATLQSKVDSLLMEMRQEGEVLMAIQRRMESDYHMISSRYAKLFRSLDSALHSRIVELDRGVFHLKERHDAKLQSRAGALQASVPNHQLESVTDAQLLTTSQTRSNALQTIRTMHRFAAESAQQKHLESTILVSQSVPARAAVFCPVLLWEHDSLIMQHTQWNLLLPPAEGELKNRLVRSTQNMLSDGLPGIKTVAVAPQEREWVETEFKRMFESATLSERVRTRMLQLFAANEWEKLERKA
jgi:hypothetical protein